ncbi:MAG: shikimate dehydrogenase [Odoribacter sp.]|nr:shikimate dehydrogenase [Odoribacter sp.]
MDLYGIIGYPLGHSRSPQYFNERFQKAGMDAQYLPFEMEDIRELEILLARHSQLKGFNVTIPHKQNILPFLDEISDEAQAIGAVNCVKVEHRDGKARLSGYNTDVHGFRKALLDFIPQNIDKALVLGNGGAAKAVRYALHSLQMEVLTVSRTPKQADEIGYADVYRHLPDFRLIVNTTPLGTWPRTESCPALPYELLTPEHYLFDLVYNPETTTFMQKGKIAGAHTCNGQSMWAEQAEKNWEIWTIS